MNTKNLNITKARLSAIFALVVFLISILLVSIFLSYKYTVSSRKDKNEFLLSGNEIAKNISNKRDFLEDFKERRIELNARPGEGRKERAGPLRPLLFTNFIVADKRNNEILFWNINKNFDIEDLIGTELKKDFFIKDSIMVRTIDLKNQFQGKILITFRDIGYTKTEYFLDLFALLVISLISSIGFYFIGYMFVSKNLKPVEENILDMQNFIHNAGHELKTPLSVIHGNLQILRSLKKYDKELTKSSIHEIEKLNQLIEGLVELSDIGKDHGTEKLNIKDQIQEIISDFSPKSNEKEILITFQKTQDIVLDINRQYFYIFFSNILGNAIKYNSQGGKIDISLTKQGIVVKDSGIGIPSEKLPKIFDRFFKADTARNQDGYGIGLSLVKKIADIYQWELHVISEEKKGTQFHVSFH